MRADDRYETRLPVEYALGDVVAHQSDYLRNISAGGLCLRARSALAPGDRIRVQIPLLEPRFRAQGTVVWCRERDGAFDVGVAFDKSVVNDVPPVVEKVCSLEAYRRKTAEEQGRELTTEQAALEWLERRRHEERKG
jgi:hypothetical protein